MKCTLCSSDQVKVFARAKEKDYYKCSHCDLVFLDPKHYLDKTEEESRYDLHNNHIEDQGYVDFLNRTIKPALEFIKPEDKGIDYGCGPNPVLAQLLEIDGYSCGYYDPIFFPDLDEKQYDFIFATECFEHFYSPEKELQAILKMLNKGGILAIMTELNIYEIDFAEWYYIIDPTHVCFYSEVTVDYICDKFGYSIAYTDKHRVVILIKE